MRTDALVALCAALFLGPAMARAEAHVRLEVGAWAILGDWWGDSGEFRCTAFNVSAGPTLAIREGAQGLVLSTDAYFEVLPDQQVSVDGRLFPVMLGEEEWDRVIDGGAALAEALDGAAWIDLHPEWEDGGGIFRLTDLPAIRRGLADCAGAAEGPAYEADLTEVPLLGEGCPDPASVPVGEEGWTFFHLRNDSGAPALVYQFTGTEEVVPEGAMKERMRLEGAPGQVYVLTDMAGRCLSAPKAVPDLAAPAMGTVDDPGPLLVFP
ncbi:hypothetical protein [Oceanicola sp. S124]|uniref:hypothetical protein n=1 Tax=Oceanicola sp. S124 TaxID=1042378 RepID=UPI00025588CE|nr:hypothetical protein [Oceanicola sp. S124]